MPKSPSSFSSIPRIVRSVSSPAGRVGLALLVGTALLNGALAQSTKKPPRGGAAPSPGGGMSMPSMGGPGIGGGRSGSSGMSPGMPGMGGSSGMSSGMGSGGMPGRRGPGDKKGGPGVRSKQSDADQYDNLSLPPGYQVPPEPPEAFTTDKEWIEDPGQGNAATTRRMDADFKSIMLAGEFRKDSDKQLVGDIIKYRLAQFTQKDFREKAADLRQKLERELEGSNNKPPPRAARQLALQTIADEAPKLFEYHFVARLQGAILLAHLSDFNETEAEGTKKAAVPCTRAVEPLINLVNDKNQLTPVRVWGINGLVRIATLDTINLQLRNRLVDLLVTQMNGSAKEHEWFQLRLAEGLGKLSVIQNAEKRPVVPQALAQVLADQNRPRLVRAEAALSLGRLQYDSSPVVDLGLIAHQTAKLMQEVVEDYVKDPTSKKALSKLCAMRVYGAFKPLEDEDAGKEKVAPKRGMLTQVEGKGSLAPHRKTVQEAFELVLPLISLVVADPKEKDVDTPLASLKKWVETNQPKTLKINPDEAPIVSSTPAPSEDRASETVASGGDKR